MKIRLQLIRTRPVFYMISDIPNISVRIFECLLYTRCITFEEDHHKDRLDMPAYTQLEFIYLETLAKIFILPSRRKKWF